MSGMKNLAPIFLGAALLSLPFQADATPAKRGRAEVKVETHASPSDINLSGRVTEPAVEPASTGKGRRAARRTARAAKADAQLGATPAFSGGGDVIAEARRYIGGNPTGRRSLWCGAFMDMVLKRTGHKGGGNLARSYANYGTRVSGPQVGAIAVMTRGGGGHVGVVTGVDASGNPIIISGNHNNAVAESVYPRGRIIAYVMPN